MTIIEVAAVTGLSRSRVWQIEQRALRKLFRRLRDDPDLQTLYPRLRRCQEAP